MELRRKFEVAANQLLESQKKTSEVIARHQQWIKTTQDVLIGQGEWLEASKQLVTKYRAACLETLRKENSFFGEMLPEQETLSNINNYAKQMRTIRGLYYDWKQKK
jgi:NAD-dependent SIR2 family protein deacetylase